ncbi:MAG: ROK family protein [Acidimicrobiia bacterium]
MSVALAVDVGGTKLAVGLVGSGGDILMSRRCPTDRDDPWSALARLIDEVMSATREGTIEGETIAVCGAGCGGPMSPGGETVSPLNIGNWRRFPLRSKLASLTGLPAFVDNDAKALALAEGWVGAARGVANYLAMVVSTGVGGGIVLDGRLLDGTTGNAGHIGHIVVEPEGRACVCGSRGCLEAEASGLAIEAVTGIPASEASPSTIERTGVLVGRAVAAVAALLDIELTVVAGSVALGFGASFFAAAQRELDRVCRIDFALGGRIQPAGLGPAGPLVGAAAVGLRGIDRLSLASSPQPPVSLG